MQSNPYSAPQAEVGGAPAGARSGEVSQGVLSHLQETKRWVRIVGVFLWLGTGMLVLAGVGVAVAGAVGGAFGDDLGTAGAIGLGLGYVLMAALYVIPARRLWSYGSRIGELMASRSTDDLEAALDAQRGFWKFIGISFLVMLAAYGVIAVVAFGAAILFGA